MLFVNRRTRNTGAELPVELGTWPGPVTKIRYRWVCERPFDLLLNLGTLSGVTIYILVYRLSLWYPNEGRMQLDSSVELHGKY